MRKSILFFLGLLLLVACNQNGEVTIQPTRAESASISPRDIVPPTPQLPPTWTPAPQPDGEHLPENLISKETEVSTSNDNLRTHVVQLGDTLGEIAAEYNVTLTALADKNDIRNWDVIEVGTVLIIP